MANKNLLLTRVIELDVTDELGGTPTSPHVEFAVYLLLFGRWLWRFECLVNTEFTRQHRVENGDIHSGKAETCLSCLEERLGD